MDINGTILLIDVQVANGFMSMKSHDMGENILTGYKEFEKAEKVSVGDGQTLDAVGVGDVHVDMQFKVKTGCHLSSALCT